MKEFVENLILGIGVSLVVVSIVLALQTVFPSNPEEAFKECAAIKGLTERDCKNIESITGINTGTVLLYKVAKESK